MGISRFLGQRSVFKLYSKDKSRSVIRKPIQLADRYTKINLKKTTTTTSNLITVIIIIMPLKLKPLPHPHPDQSFQCNQRCLLEYLYLPQLADPVQIQQ